MDPLATYEVREDNGEIPDPSPTDRPAHGRSGREHTT